jgi:predicted dinucleotide-binding enzyme
MKIAVYGKGHVGGGLADLWEQKGHSVTRLGRDGGDVSAVEVILIAVPGDKLSESLGKLKGAKNKTVIDATNLIGGAKPPAGFASNAEFIKSKTNGPTAKSFNINFAALYDRLGEARAKPSNVWCGDQEARTAVEQLSRDAGYEPVCMGPLANAAAQESLLGPVFAIAQSGMGPFVYRISSPDKL